MQVFSLFILSFLFISQTWAKSNNLVDYPALPLDNKVVKSALFKSKFNSLLEILPGSQSDEFSWLNSENDKRNDFLKTSENEFNQRFSKNSQFENIYNFLEKNNKSTEAEEFKVEINSSRKITVNRAAQFLRTWQDIDGETKTTILSSDQYLPQKAAFVGLYPSTNKSFVAAMVSINGNIDNVELIVYDVNQKKVIFKSEVTSWLEDALWSSDSEIYYTHPASSSQGVTLILQDFKTGQKRQLYNHGSLSFENWVGHEDYATQNVFLKNVKTGQQLFYKDLNLTGFVAETNDAFYIKSNSQDKNHGKIFKLAKNNEDEPSVFVDRKENFYISNFSALKNGLFLVEYSRDSQVTLVLVQKDQKILSEITLPLNASYNGLEIGESTTHKLTVKYHGGTYILDWNVQNSEVDFSDVLKTVLKYDDIEIESRIEYFPSEDGSMIPARIVHKKGLLMDADRPVFMEAYGGFNLMGYLSPTLSKTKQEFVKRGGIYVGTGVRGGAERGYLWHKSGAGKTELNTTLDVIAIANGLVSRGYTKSEKIVLTGGSNGGYVVANAALTSPDSFGLIIPVNGVQDQIDFPNLDRWGLGWISEYLNPFEPTELKQILKRAPLELSPVAVKTPSFFIINGENDSRVNKVHSYKLKAKLDQLWPNKAILYSVKNAGHWATSPYLIDDIGIKAGAVMWAHIYEYLGMTF